jgi:predicted Zn-dependent protease
MAAEASASASLRTVRRATVITAALLLGFCLAGMRADASEPRPVQPFYNRFTSEDEAKLGIALAHNIEANGIPVVGANGTQQTMRIKRDPALESYLESIASKLAHSSQRPEIRYSVLVLDAPDVVNAFSIPGGHIYVSAGLLDFVQNEAELAAVLGHEIGHVVARHASNRIARVSLFSLLVNQARDIGLISDEATAQKLADTAMPILFAADARTFYSRDDEIEADLLGLYELVRAGWNPEGETTLLARLAKATPEQSALTALIATHPNSSDRLLVIQNECRTAAFASGLTRDSAEFKAMKDAMHGVEKDRSPSGLLLPVTVGSACVAFAIAGLLWSARKQMSR